MTEFYTDIAEIVLDTVSDKYVGGPSFTGSRATGGTPATAPTVGSLSSRTLYFIPASLETFQNTFPEQLVWKAPWLVFAASNVDVQYGDTYTDGSLSYVITGQPVTHYGFLLGPAATL